MHENQVHGTRLSIVYPKVSIQRRLCRHQSPILKQNTKPHNQSVSTQNPRNTKPNTLISKTAKSASQERGSYKQAKNRPTVPDSIMQVVKS